MRTAWWACTFIVVLTCSVAYQLSSQPLLLDRSSGVSAESERPPLDQKSDRPLVYNDEARLQDVPSAPPDSKSDRRPIAQDQARLQDAAGTAPVEHSEPNRANQNLSYLAYYAYSELPPETKPADTVLNALKGYPPGTPVEEIKRVTDVLGLDFTFMKAVAKIESGFNPKQRTGSYIGLFQLSEHEFAMYVRRSLTRSRP
jgi:soluble lytic murein transglycosylase-like protein